MVFIKEIEEDTTGDGWDGDQPEVEWAHAMHHCVRHKLSAIRKEGFDRFDENWLLLYDNWSLPNPDIRKSAALFFQDLKHSGALQEIDRVYIMRNKLLCEVSANGVRLYNANDLRF